MLYGCTLYEQKIAISIFISDFDIVSDGAFSCRDLCVCVCVFPIGGIWYGCSFATLHRIKGRRFLSLYQSNVNMNTDRNTHIREAFIITFHVKKKVFLNGNRISHPTFGAM